LVNFGRQVIVEAQYRQLADGGLLAELAKRDMMLHGPAHCFNLLLHAEDYMTNHPDWFGLRGGKQVPQTFAGAQFCWSNPVARKQFTDNVEAFARQAPQIHILCLVPFDGGQACECDQCRKVGASNLLMLLMGEVIEPLKTSRPDLPRPGEPKAGCNVAAESCQLRRLNPQPEKAVRNQE